MHVSVNVRFGVRAENTHGEQADAQNAEHKGDADDAAEAREVGHWTNLTTPTHRWIGGVSGIGVALTSTQMASPSAVSILWRL